MEPLSRAPAEAGLLVTQWTPHDIRQLQLEDADGWAVLRREALEEDPLVFGSSVPDDPQQLVEIGRERLAPSEDAAVFGAFEGAKLVGIVGVRREPGRKERHKTHVWGVYVTAASRGHGVGGAMLRAAIDKARSWPGVELAGLSVSEAANRAWRMYERHGFRAWGREPRALCWEGRSVDEIHMTLDLREPDPA